MAMAMEIISLRCVIDVVMDEVSFDEQIRGANTFNSTILELRVCVCVCQ